MATAAAVAAATAVPAAAVCGQRRTGQRESQGDRQEDPEAFRNDAMAASTP